MELTRGEEANVLKEDLVKTHRKLTKAHKKMRASRETYLEHEKVWSKLSEQHRRLDYQLAMLDGRYKVLSPQGTRKTREKDVSELTTDQILRIAEELGVDLK